ncbi:MAG: hypothetical protein KY469_19010 [Actinobacteria bacterium]|nr:hypothetical protein [Actinomycetota bacterium]
MENLSNGQKIALGGGLVLLISSFLPWYGVDLGGFGGVSINAWNAGFLAWAGVLVGLAAAVLIALKAFQGNAVSAGGFATEQLAVILAGIGLVLILLRLITETNFLKYGIFVGLVAAAAMTYGAFLSMREAGLDLDVDDFKGKLGGGGTSAGGEPPPPPRPDEPPPPPPPAQ